MRQRSEGIIAPRTPNRSPMLSPAIGALPQGNWSLSGEDLFADNPAPKLTPPPPRRVTTDGLGLGLNTGLRVSSGSNLRAMSGSPRLGLDFSDSPRDSMDSLDENVRYGSSKSAMSSGTRPRNVSRRVTIVESDEVDSPGGL